MEIANLANSRTEKYGHLGIWKAEKKSANFDVWNHIVLHMLFLAIFIIEKKKDRLLPKNSHCGLNT